MRLQFVGKHQILLLSIARVHIANTHEDSRPTNACQCCQKPALELGSSTVLWIPCKDQ